MTDLHARTTIGDRLTINRTPGDKRLPNPYERVTVEAMDRQQRVIRIGEFDRYFAESLIRTSSPLQTGLRLYIAGKGQLTIAQIERIAEFDAELDKLVPFARERGGEQAIEITRAAFREHVLREEEVDIP